MTKKILEMKNISMSFGGVYALKDINFDLMEGEIHALIGENGAGKSTLIKILGGVYHQVKGDIYINGVKQVYTTARGGIDAGIGIIYQEFNLVQTLSIAENIYLGKELRTSAGMIDRKTMIKNCNQYISGIGFPPIDCSEKVQNLSTAQQQIVEITKALFNNSKILVMDEPTAVLTENESEKLFEVIRRLKKQGVGIIYISHRLEEVLSLSDRITVLRDGEFVKLLQAGKDTISKELLVKLMVGRDLDEYFPKRNICIEDKTVLEVKNLNKADAYENISFKLRKGEILGITGLVGSGISEVVKSVFGAISYDSGNIYLNGEKIENRSPVTAIKNNIAYIPEDRKHEGLFLDTSIENNMFMANYKKISRHRIILDKLKKKFVSEYFRKLDIRPTEPKKMARFFSGGNQQKAILAKWIATDPQILILNEPTRGIDIGAKAEIYQVMNSLVEKGRSIIMVSSEMQEIMGMSDHVYVMAEGRISGEFFSKDGFDQEKIMEASSAVTMKK